MQTIKRIGVVANLDKADVPALLKAFVPQLLNAGLAVSVSNEVAGTDNWDVTVGIGPDCDLICAIGGDGTILKAAREFIDTPILGIKAGRVGFLTETLTDDTVARIKEGRFHVQERMRIQATIVRGGKQVQTFSALNDIVVHVTGFSRMVRLRTEVDGKLLREFSSDGVIVATPTGSTAYSLSAGGPLLVPTIQAMVVTPLSPHSLSNRPLVIDASERVSVHIVTAPDDIHVTFDGQQGYDLQKDEHVSIEKSRAVTLLAVPEEYDFFARLREKL